MAAPVSFGTPWNHRDLASMTGTEIEWSTIVEEDGKKKTSTRKECALCGHKFGGGPAVIRTHLDASLFPRDIRPCKPITEAVERHKEVVDMLRVREKESNAAKKAEKDRLATEAQRRADVHGQTVEQERLNALFGKPTEQEVTEAWVKVIVKKALPLDIVDDPLFRGAIKVTAKLGTGYLDVAGEPKLPSRKTVTYKVLPKIDDDLDASARTRVLGVVKRTGAMIISDGWSSVANRPIVNALAATPLGVFFIKAVDTSGETKDANFIANFVNTEIIAFGRDNVTAVCMDGACKQAFAFIEAQNPRIFCFICPTHSVDNFLKNINGDNDEVRIQVSYRARLLSVLAFLLCAGY
jgi:hypothetical protein